MRRPEVFRPAEKPSLLMTAIAKAATDMEVPAASAYFSSLKPKPNIKVVETDTLAVRGVCSERKHRKGRSFGQNDGIRHNDAPRHYRWCRDGTEETHG
jgi:hypothetical protein